MTKYLLDAIGAVTCVTGLILIGNKKWYGFIVTTASAFVYLLMGFVIGLPCLIGLNCIMVFIHIRNLRKWRKEEKGGAISLDLSLLWNRCKEDDGFRRALLAYLQTASGEKGFAEGFVAQKTIVP